MVNLYDGSESLKLSSLTELLAKDSTNYDPGRVINISSVASKSTNAEQRYAAGGSGTWSCTFLAYYEASHSKETLIQTTRAKPQVRTIPRP